MNYASHVIKLEGRKERSRCFGGKASSLNALIDAGFPVPTAYCVTTEAYDAFLKESGLANWIDGVDELDAKVRAEIRSRIENVEIPADLREAIVNAYRSIGSERVAVRSSAVHEDGAFHSFAGQYDTFLYVNGEEAVLDSVKRCWGSLWAGRAEAYRNRANKKNSGSDGHGEIAVVIQQMIDADMAGVLFTVDPLDPNAKRTLIESCWGVGEGVVAGKVVTDTYVVDSDRLMLIENTIRHKSLMSGYAETGRDTILRATPAELVSSPTLTDAKAIELVVYANAIRKHFGKELDIEWAIQDGKIWILQARPITRIASKENPRIYGDAEETDPHVRENTLFSRMDTGEIVTGLMTPLGLSFCRFYQYHIHGPSAKAMGLLDSGNPQHYMGYIQGQVYLNISASALLLTQCPPTRDPMKFTRRYATDEVDLSKYVNPYGAPVSGFDYVKSSLYWLVIQLRNMITANRTVRKMVALRERETARFLKLNLSAMTPAELDVELKRIDHYFLKASASYFPFFLQSFALYDGLAELCGKWFKGEGQGLQNRIKAAMNNLRTIEVTRGICKLVDCVHASASLKRLILDTPLQDLAETLQKDKEGQQFWNNDVAAFLQNFGTRGRQEFELSIPRWNDNQIYLLQVIRMYLVSDVQLEFRLKETDEAREKDTRQLLSKVPFKTRMLFKLLIVAYSKNAERRESTRPTLVAETWFYRKIIVEVLRRLSNEGIVSMDDLPYVDFSEFRAYIAGKKSAQAAFSRESIERNRQRHLLNLRLKEPPMAIIGGWAPERDLPTALGADDRSGAIRGLGASPGVVVGRARVITDLDKQAEEFQQGEILVTRFTDASWTPLFVLAAGVVAEIGSMLSHSSIVSREFGIPAIVNAKGVTRTINTGDLLSIDGTSGIVQIEEIAEQRTA